jgi:hypothetical protein
MGSPLASGKTNIFNGMENVRRRPQRSTFPDGIQFRREFGL